MTNPAIRAQAENAQVNCEKTVREGIPDGRDEPGGHAPAVSAHKPRLIFPPKVPTSAFETLDIMLGRQKVLLDAIGLAQSGWKPRLWC
ncbi:hypothetical protein Prubr_18400 [Polymorphospora rubra]|uniref:Uncharacterized protein n=1 Tax=Polymorphospora rubra TaxID=338584 RepID=A0A810MXX0_9ACTN|nr:hypothetical protein Prubr_18400 [Polymorphospora rubra]